MNLTDALAVYGAVGSTAALVWSSYSWRRVPEGYIELRSLSRRSAGSSVEFSAIAVNKSPQPSTLTQATVRGVWELLERYDVDGGTVIQHGREEWPGPFPTTPVRFEGNHGVLERRFTGDVEVDLVAEGKLFPLRVEPAQGQHLLFEFAMSDYARLLDFPVEFRIETSTGRTFSARRD